MSLKLNIAANYVSQVYVALIGIALLPLYMRLLGAEGYGLIAFFSLLQAWLPLLDVGLTATATRETARYRGGGYDSLAFRQLLRSLEGFFWCVGTFAALCLGFASGYFANHWLNVQQLSPATVELSLRLIAVTVAARWVSGLYRGVVAGLERQVWLGGFNMAIVSLRFVGPIPLLMSGSIDVTGFFVVQALVSGVELLILTVYSYLLVPLPPNGQLRWSLAPMRSVLRFSATVAFTSVVGILILQTDKLLVSKLVSLQEYGLYTATVMVANGITLIAAPISLALLPRLTVLAQQGERAAVFALYRKATQAVAALAGASALVMAAFATKVIWVWTGDPEFAANYGGVLAMYAVGNGFLALASFPYYLQYAEGNLRLHLYGNVVFLVTLVPAIVWATARHGVAGAGAVWLLVNLAFFLVWTAVVHRRFLPGQHGEWLRRDVLGVLALPVLMAGLMSLVQEVPGGRLLWTFGIVVAGLATVATAVYSGSLLRPHLHALMARCVPIMR
ncbi:MAG: oligosaccharide flippase family protein [Pseudomonadota bacterium]|nr:oligosaccharide flippase family protein [Pseudomonadota bacterium]